jgi:hypothetical protein
MVFASETAKLPRSACQETIKLLKEGGIRGKQKHKIQPATTNSIGCIIPARLSNVKRPKIKVTGQGKKEHYVAFVVLVADGRADDVAKISKAVKGQPDDEIFEASHWCHHPKCINPQHIFVETRKLNRDRNRCLGHTKIRCKCGEVINPCKHNPPCILPDPEDAALAEEIWRLSQQDEEKSSESSSTKRKASKDEED